MRFSILIGVLVPLSVCAQDPRRTITGQVVDASSAVIPGVSVKATNLETNVVVTAVSNAQGAYEVPYLLPGTYKWMLS